jgi:hypothetical protein
MRALRELGATLLLWDDAAATFRAFGPRTRARLPVPQRRDGSIAFDLGHRLSPYDLEGLELSVIGNPQGGWVRWGSSGLSFGSGVAAGDRTVFRIDLTHDLGFLAQDLAGGVERFEFQLRGGEAPIHEVELRLLARLPQLPLQRELRGREVHLGEEAQCLAAPAIPEAGLELRLVLLAPSEPIAVPVEPGQPVRFPSHLDLPGGRRLSLQGELNRLLRLSRQKRFYYYYEAGSPAGRALGGARSAVDWFRLLPRRT